MTIHTLEQAYTRDQRVWDACASTYEQHIVSGHPEVTAYEAFEEDLLDRILLYLVRDQRRAVHLVDVGCGSGRLHRRYGLKMADASTLGEHDGSLVQGLRAMEPDAAFDPELSAGLTSVEGIDFSAAMLDLAREKLTAVGLGPFIEDGRLRLRQGSAFELTSLSSDPMPVAVTLCNSIGVMQGPAGAQALFQSMRQAVEIGGGVAIISAYLGEAVETHALGNYESTMSVCGQPRWLKPDTYAGPEYVQVPRRYKRAYDTDSAIEVDVFDQTGRLRHQGFVLERDEPVVAETIQTGQIRTYTDYESHWYPFEQFDAWIAEFWAGCRSYHLKGRSIDALRGAPAQLAVLDPSGALAGFLKRLLG